MEYIVVYGWAILVVLSVGVLLWQLGIFDSTPATVTSTGFAKLKPQTAGTGLVSNDGLCIFRGIFLNAAGGKILIKGVRVYDAISGADDPICCSHDGAGTNCKDSTVNIAGKALADFKSTDKTKLPRIATGDNFILELGNPTGAQFCDIPSAKKGKPYNIKVEIDYDIISGRESVPHTDVGSIRGPFE
jgi:hypothetical protein